MKHRDDLCKLSTVELSVLLQQCYVYLDDITKACYLMYPTRLSTEIYSPDNLNELSRLVKIRGLEYLYLVPIENYLLRTDNVHPVLKLELLYLL
jgi:hypothetical protein